MSGRGGRYRSLSEEERTLWRDVTRGIAPLRAATPSGSGSEIVLEASSPSAAKAAKSAGLAPRAPSAKADALPALAPLGRRAKQRLARGRDVVDGRLDLHGLTQAQAHGALLRFLQTAQMRGAKLVIVITGKGSRGAQAGVLRRQVPLWLKLPEFRAYVVGFEDAHRAHGGEGALYVRVRRGADPTPRLPHGTRE